MRTRLLVFLLALATGCATGSGLQRGHLPVPGVHHVESGRIGPVAAEGALELRVVDVGQGDGILIRSPSGKTMLVDAGSGSGGYRIAEQCKMLGIHRIDHVVMSHAHLDHMGGFVRLLEGVEFGEVIDPGAPHPSRTYERFLEEVERRKIPYRIARRGMEIDLGGGARAVLLAPDEPLFVGTRSDLNANSAVVRVDFGDVCAVLSGDAELETEDRVLASGDPVRCAVLKVAHHGSGYSSGDNWVDRVHPLVAVVSAGRNNRYGHPHPLTLQRLRDTGARVYRTDLHGTVIVRTDGKRIMVMTDRLPNAASEGGKAQEAQRR